MRWQLLKHRRNKRKGMHKDEIMQKSIDKQIISKESSEHWIRYRMENTLYNDLFIYCVHMNMERENVTSLCGASAPVPMRGGCQLHFSAALLLSLLRQSTSAARLVASKSQWSSCLCASHQQLWGYRCMCGQPSFLCRCWDLNLGLHACITSALSHSSGP